MTANINSFFSYNGYVYLKNFLEEHEVDTINKYRQEIVAKENRDLYTINFNNLKKINLKYISIDKFKKFIQNNIEKNFKSFDVLLNFFIQQNLELENLKNNDNLKYNLHIAFCNESQSNFSYVCDIILQNKTSDIFLKEKFLELYKSLLGANEIIYWGESGFTFNKPPVRGWHSDDPINTQYKLDEDTSQIRVAMYPDSVPNRSGGLKLLPKSHKYNSLPQVLKNFIKFYFLKKHSYKGTFDKISIINLSRNFFPSSRDVLIWDKRLMHSPWANLLKIFNFISLSPSMESGMLDLFFKKPCFPRSILSFDLGKRSAGLDRYINDWISKREDYKNYWASRDKFENSEVIKNLKNKGIIYKKIKL